MWEPNGPFAYWDFRDRPLRPRAFARLRRPVARHWVQHQEVGSPLLPRGGGIERDEG